MYEIGPFLLCFTVCVCLHKCMRFRVGLTQNLEADLALFSIQVEGHELVSIQLSVGICSEVLYCTAKMLQQQNH